MRKKIIASIILIIMLWQAIGNCCLAVVNEISMNESSQEVNTTTADNEIATNNVLSENTVEETNTTKADETKLNSRAVTNSELEESSSNQDANKSMEVGNQYITEDDLLYSNKYLVKDRVVSRIDPKTTILEFKQGVEIAKGNELKFYKNDGVTEVTQGILGTGMLVRGTNGQEYKLSVKGDMTGEGETNQVELTMMIRHVIELQGWELTDVNAASGDITGDGEINLVDVNKMIKHIVYGDWEYDTRTTPNPPTIEVVGEEGEDADLYTSEVRVRIVEDKSTENLKTTYKLSGKVEKEESSIEDDEEITISEDGEYLITAYTYGVQGNRSKASNRKIVINTEEQPEQPEQPDEPEIYNITYELSEGTNNSENPSTYTYGTEVTLKDPTREGYTFDGWYKEPECTNKIEKIESTQTGDITVYAKWSASKYDITYELNGGTNSPENPDQYTYGEETVLKDPTKEGNTFDGWYKEPEFINKIEKTEITQIGEITIYAKWIVNEYNIIYELNGGTNSSENVDKYTYGTEITLKDPTREGYTFDGWYKEPECTNKIEKIESTQTGDITVYAKWSASKYDITYELNGGTNSSENPDQYTYGEETILKDPTKEGNTFDGWYKEPEFINKIEKTEITQIGEITVYAKWIINEYNITYELNGGTNSSENVDKYTYGTEVTLKDPEREGYTFDGWYKEPEFTNKIEKIESTQTGDITVYAKWSVNKYNITYELNGGTNSSENPDQYTYGEETVLKDPIKEGNTFDGWYKEPEFINKIEKTEITQIGEITIYAKWIVNEYNITYELNGGTNSSENVDKYTYGTEITFKDPTKEGYTFEGWYKEAEFKNKIEKVETTQIGDITVYAKWSASKYDITYELNGGTNSPENPDQYTYGEETVLKDPTKEGNTFDGWYKEPEFINKIEKTEITQIGEITVYAKWIINEYNITYELNGGTNSSENVDKYTYGTEITLKDPTREGYTFDGWYKESEFTNKIEKIESTQTGDITVYAKWSANKYDITYELNGGTNSSENPDQYTYGEETILKDPTKEGYTFDGWYTEPEFINKIEKTEITQTEDITIYAKWIIDEYQITYELDGGINSSENVDKYTYGTEITFKDPTKEGYTFEGWYKEAEFTNIIEKIESTQTGDITVYAKWNQNEYTIQATAQDGGVVENETETVKHGENSTKQIKIIPNADMQVDTITINDVEFLDYEEDEDTGIVILPIFENVTENKNIVITFGEILPVVKIIAAPEGYEDLVGKEYKKITKALEDITIDGVTLQLIADTKEEVTLTDRQITLDLNGKSVKGNATVVTIENSNLTLINSNSSEQGKIISATETAIYVKDSGTFSLGQNEGTVETDKMLIQGETSGVKNEGTFNFYDGTITATKAIDGEATEVPLRYNISIGEQDSKQVATLQVMAGAEAAIGQKTFFKLEDAIAYANESIATDGSQVEVTIIDNLQKTETVEVADSKNIKLNLNGYEVSFLNVDDGITNNGKLEIVDTIGTGKIISTVRRTIRNEEGAELIMTSGTIVATGSNSFGICNYSTGIVTVTGGTITATKNGIYIGSTGTEIVKVTGGTITSNADSGIVNSGLGELRVEGGTVKTAGTAAILNNSTGIITVTGGTVTSTASNCYGINNNSNGTVTVAGGTVTGARYGIYNNVAGTIIIDDGKVSTTDTSSYGIYNNSTGTITINNGEIVASTSYSRGIYMKSGAVIMTGGTITSSSYGIDNYNGIVTMTGGIISSNSDGIYNSSTGTISIGEKDGTVNDASPSITSTQYGVYNNSSGKFNFYDGIIEGAVGQSLYGAVNEIEEGYNIIQTVEDSKEISTLGISECFKVVETDTVYSNLQDAIDSIDTDEVQTIQVLSDTIITADRGATNDKNIVLDLNGKAIKLGKSGTIDNNGTLEIIDSSENKTGVMTALAGRGVVNEESATLKVTGGTITNALRETSAIDNMGTMQVDGGTINATEYYSNVILNRGAGTLVVTGGTVTTSNYGNTIVNQDTATLTVTGGNVKSLYDGNSAIYNSSTGEVTVEGGTIISYENGIYNASTGAVIVNGGWIETSGYGIYNKSTGTVTVNDGTVIVTYRYSYAISNSTGTVIIKGGNITGNGEGSVAITNSGGTLIVEGGTITSGSWNAMYISGGTATITGATIKGNNYGMCISYTPTVTIGEKDGNVSTTVPSITGGQYGLYNESTGKVNFYDGVFTGATGKSTYGSMNEIEEEYDVVKTVDETTSTETAILQKVPAIINTTTNTEYYSLQTAITEAGENETLQVLRNMMTYSTQATIVVEEEKDVVLDLNGYSITFGQVNAIKNLGILTIEDSSESKAGSILSTVGNVITNEDGATLNITGGTITNTLSNTNAIYNTGILQLDGGTVKVTNIFAYGIYNASAGIVTVAGGTVLSTGDYSYGIYNNSTGTVTVDGGTVRVTAWESYGIYNNSSGEVIVSNGEVTMTNSYTSGIYNKSSGTVKMTGGKVTVGGSSDAIENESAGTVIISNGEVIGTGNYGDAISDYGGTLIITGGNITATGSGGHAIGSSGTLTLEGGTITGSYSNAIEFSGKTSTITGGTIKGNTYGIYISSTGTVTIGEKDGNVSTTDPSITGGQYGLYNSSTAKVNFYDGIIQGPTGKSTYGSMNEIENEYDLVKTVDETTSTETAILQKIPAIINTTTNTEYYSLQTAIAEAGEQEKLQVLRNMMTYSAQETIEVEAEKDVVLDLNGYSITFGKANAIKNLGTFAIEDGSEGKTGSMLSTVGNIITNEEGATLKTTGGTITNTVGYTSSIDNMGILQVEGGTIQATGSSSKTIINRGTGTVIVTGGSVTTSSADDSIGIYNNSTGTVTVEGGTVIGDKYGIYNALTGTVIVNEGRVSATDTWWPYSICAIYNNTTGGITITGGTLTSNGIGIQNYSTGTIMMSGGTITTTEEGIINSAGGLTITGGSITANGEEAIYNSRGIVTIEDATITSSSVDGIYNDTGRITIIGGTVTGNNGIYNNSTGEITIGEKDGNVSATVPSITGTQYGVYNSSTGIVNFYDGILKGSTQAISGNVTDIETNYEIKYAESATIATLELTATNYKSISIGDIYYETLQAAVNDAQDGATIELWADVTLESTVEIPEGLNITIELNGNNLTGNGLDVLINNRGTVNVVDSVGTGSISNPDGETIKDVT